MVSLKQIQLGQPSKLSDLAIQKIIINQQEQKQENQKIQYYPKNMEELLINLFLAIKIIYIQMIALFETCIMIIKSLYDSFCEIQKKNGIYYFFELMKNITLIILCFNIRILQFITKIFQQLQQNPVKQQ
ncbi:unnamed protein product [Paramecium pentaurelia]|uniref:Transmembrane protein n=1 Tax=Paramecium pentaurelia TaxID=43138 RepID=A0A8S1UQG0_9CILI|nr:unnamed protein product [Paramecium pentaurelia]